MKTIPDRQTELEVIELMLFGEVQPRQATGLTDRELALSALRGLGASRADDYRSWICVGMALHSTDGSDSMLQEWDAWSRSSEKYKDGECATKWKGFDSNGKVTIGSLVYWAKADGWTQPRKPKAEKNSESPKLNEKPKTKDPPVRLLWKPFPTHVLPGIAGKFVREAAAAIGCDEAYVALPTLAIVAGAIGNRRSILLKGGWVEPCVIWSTIVGDSGSLKSPALDAPLRPIRAKQAEELKRHQEALAGFVAEKLRHEAAVASWKQKSKKGTDEPPPAPPEEPACPRYWVSDTTVEAIAKVFLSAVLGLVLVCDELAGWLKSFGQYKGGKGADIAHWLSMHGARNLFVDRKTSGTIYVPTAALSLTGGIQPVILRQALAREHFEDGLAARLLVSMPPTRPKRWTEAELTQAVEDEYAELINQLYALEPEYDDAASPKPKVLPLTTSAKSLWVQFYNEHGEEQAACTGDLVSAFSKLEGYAARLALVLQLISDPEATCVDAQAMRAGIALSRWFMYECRRVYAALGETDLETQQRRLIELIQRKGGTITVRELTHGDRQYAGKAELAEEALEALVKEGFGDREDLPPGPKGGRPTWRFHLHKTPVESCLQNPSESAETEGIGDETVSGDSNGESDEVGEWVA